MNDYSDYWEQVFDNMVEQREKEVGRLLTVRELDAVVQKMNDMMSDMSWSEEDVRH